MHLKGLSLFHHSGTTEAVAQSHLYVIRRIYPMLLLSIGNIFGDFFL